MDKTKICEKILLGVAVIAFALLLVLVIHNRVLDSQTPLSVNTHGSETDSYDVSVINQATYEDFLNIKGIGASKATAIVELREALGGFDSVYQIGELSAISDSLLDAIIEYFYACELPVTDSHDTELPVTTVSEDFPEPELSETESLVTEPAVTVITTEDTTISSLASTQATSKPAVTEISTTTETSYDLPQTEQSPVMRAVYINTATAEEISDCLLLDIDIAREIVYIRDLIGGYSNISELTLCDSIFSDMSIYEKIKDFVIIF